jgi:hypothetical protein
MSWFRAPQRLGMQWRTAEPFRRFLAISTNSIVRPLLFTVSRATMTALRFIPAIPSDLGKLRCSRPRSIQLRVDRLNDGRL